MKVTSNYLEDNTKVGIGDTVEFIEKWGTYNKGTSFVITGLFYSGYFRSAILCGKDGIEAVPWKVKLVKKNKLFCKRKSAYEWGNYLNHNQITPASLLFYTDISKNFCSLLNKFLGGTRYWKSFVREDFTDTNPDYLK